MENSIKDIERKVDSLKKELYELSSKFDQIVNRIDEIYREIGTRTGGELHRQVTNIEQRLDGFDQLITDIARDARATRKLSEYGDSKLKEIMKALSLIYRNTDELEENLIEAENIETR